MAAAKKADISPETVVMTVEGVCEPAPAHPTAHAATAKTPATASHAAKTGTDCKTVVTRAQFESLADALQPNMNAATRKQLATFYPKLLLYAQEARQRGIDKDPKIKQALEFKRLQALAQELVRTTQEKASQVSDAEIEKYYKDNSAVFEQVGLQRLYVANNKIHNPSDEDKDDKKEDDAKAEATRKADEEVMKKEADSVHDRAAKGEDFEKLQKEAYEVAGLQGTPPKTDIGRLTRAELPANHRAALDLNMGQVSQIFVEGNGYYIYKVTSKDIKPLAQVREQIRATVAQQKTQDALQALDQKAKTELNEAYFAPPPAPVKLPAPLPTGAAATPSAPTAPAAAPPAATPAKPAEASKPTPPGPGDPKN
jgi:parvulin-like peptidyl-prolyl isomerase